MQKYTIDAGLDRLKKHQAVADIVHLINSKKNIYEICKKMCDVMCKSMRYPDITLVKVQIGEISFSTPAFNITPWGLNKNFDTADNGPGCISIYYADEMDWPQGCPFSPEEVDLLDKTAFLLSGVITKSDFEKLLIENIERNKELSGLERISAILKRNEPLQVLLQEICNALPASWKYPEHAVARLTYDDIVFSTPDFCVTPWIQVQKFQVPEGPYGSIEICYLLELPAEDDGPFLKEEQWLLNNIGQLLAVALGCKIYEQLVSKNRERLKELHAINQTTQIISMGKPISDTLQSICSILPASWQFPEFAAAKITYEDNIYTSESFQETPWVQREPFITIDNKTGLIEVFYLKDYPSTYEGPFLKEERDLINNIARLVAHFINNQKGRELIALSNKRKTHPDSGAKNVSPKTDNSMTTTDAVPSYINCNKVRIHVREVLIIASHYDIYTFLSEVENRKPIVDPFCSQNMWTIPQFSFASTIDQAVRLLSENTFDLVFLIAEIDNKDLVDSLNLLHTKFPELHFYCITKKSDQGQSLKSLLQTLGDCKTSVFQMQNDPAFILMLCKYFEDSLNLEQYDAPGVLLVEDTPEFYTPMIVSLYSTIFDTLESKKTIDNLCKTRLRLMLAKNYEDAVYFSKKFGKSIVGIFSDIEFPKNGTLQTGAGFMLIDAIRDNVLSPLYIFNSTDPTGAAKALQMNTIFLNKKASDILQTMCNLISTMHTLHFDDDTGTDNFYFEDICDLFLRLPKLQEDQVIRIFKLPSIINWLLTKHQFSLANSIAIIQKVNLTDNEFIVRINSLLKEHLSEYDIESSAGSKCIQKSNKNSIKTVSTGSIGGKGRSATFLHMLIKEQMLKSPSEEIQLRSPLTLIIRSGEYEVLLSRINIKDYLTGEKDAHLRIQDAFDKVELSSDITDALTSFIKDIKTPLAVRSSSLFEDSLTQPFAGVFETYIIPNNDPDISVRLQQLTTAIKRVYASTFLPEAQLYFTFSGNSVEDERMAVVIQELAGLPHDTHFYPQLCGVAGSYNFYPVGHMKPEEGFAVMAFGLGVYVAEGRSGHRFSPAYPEIDFGSTKDLLNSSQTQFYAVDLSKHELNFNTEGEKAGLDLLDIASAEKNGTLKHCASVYDYENDRIVPDLNISGPRIVNFDDILKYNYIPLAETLNYVLQKLASYMKSPVEIEFALDTCDSNVSQPALYLLQVKPLAGEKLGYNIDDITIDRKSCILYSETSMGNGKFDNLTDIVIFNVEEFDRLKTDDMVREVEYFNRLQMKNKSSYILIGPGRWGTRDKSLGIPVAWSQICNAKVIVEVGMSDFHLDASLGSHFFHNVTAMKVGYIAVNENRGNEFIEWDKFNKMHIIERQKYFRLLRSENPLSVQIDGRKKKAVIVRS
jgi:hypothetical protein